MCLVSEWKEGFNVDTASLPDPSQVSCVVGGGVEIAEKAEEQWNCGGGTNARTVHKKGLLLDTHTQFLDRVLKELQGKS